MSQALPSISEELTIEECCAAISSKETPMDSKIAMILTLASKFSKSEDLSCSHADIVLQALPEDLLGEAFLPNSINFQMYQELLTSVLTTLLTSCSIRVLQQRQTLVKYILDYLERKKLSTTDTDIIVSLLDCLVQRCQSLPSESLRCLNLLGKVITKDTTILPSLEVLNSCNKAIIHLGSLANSDLRCDSEIAVSLKTLISRILHSPPQRLADDYRKYCFEFINSISDIFGSSWFVGSQKLLCLVAHLVCMQFRIILDKPSEISLEELITCASLAEVCIKSVDEDDIVDDDAAIIISKAVKEMSDFVIEYWGEAMISEEVLSIEVQLILYRYLCVFLAIGGSQLVDVERLRKVSPFAVEVCYQAVKNKDYLVARQLICVLEQLPTLDNERTLPILLEYAFEENTTEDRKEEVLEVLDALLPRNDWYSKTSLLNALKASQEYGDKMIVLSEVANPAEGVRLIQPQVQAYFDNTCAGDGTLCIAESSVTWIDRQTQKGFSITYPSICLHAISTELSSFPHECIFVLVDCSKTERRRRHAVPFYTAAEGQNVTDLNIANEELNDGEDDESESGPTVSIRFVPTDSSILRQVYDEMCACQELNPDEDDMSDEEETAMEQINEAEMGANWYTADNMPGDVQLSEEGMANLQRMLGNAGGDQVHQDDEDME